MLVEALFSFIKFTDIIDIICVALFVYGLLRLAVRGRSTSAMRGITWCVIGFILAFGIAKLLQLTTILMLFSYFWITIIIITAIVFQQEIRKLILSLGRMWVVQRLIFPENFDAMKTLCETVMRLSKTKTGALICIQREDSLDEYSKFGVTLNADISDDLLVTIFTPPSKLHDGAVFIQGDKILAACGLLPLTDREDLPSEMGTRHRAAIGLSEEKDAIVIVVSEESGRVSVCKNGMITPGFKSATDLRAEISRLQNLSEDKEEEMRVQAKTVSFKSLDFGDRAPKEDTGRTW